MLRVYDVSLAEGGGERDDRDEIASTDAKSSSAESIHMPQQPSIGSNTGQNTPVQPRTASIRSRPTSSRITAAELEVTISHPLAARAPDMLPLSFFRSITQSLSVALVVLELNGIAVCTRRDRGFSFVL